MKKLILFSFILAGWSSHAQLGWNNFSGFSHFSIGSRLYSKDKIDATHDYYHENLKKGYSTHNFHVAYGYSIFKKGKLEIQLKGQLEWRQQYWIAYSNAPETDPDKLHFQDLANEDLDLSKKDLSMFVGVQSNYMIHKSKRWIHSLGGAAYYCDQQSEQKYLANSSSEKLNFNNSNSSIYSFNSNSFVYRDESGQFLYWGKNPNRVLLDLNLIISNQLALSPQMYIRFEQKVGTMLNVGHNKSIKTPFYFESSISFTLWEFRNSRKLLREERKKRKSKNEEV